MNIEELIKKHLREGKICFQIKVIPKSNHTEIIGEMSNGTLKIRVAAVPEKNKANAEIIKFLANTFNVDKTRVHIVTGETSPIKLIEIK